MAMPWPSCADEPVGVDRARRRTCTSRTVSQCRPIFLSGVAERQALGVRRARRSTTARGRRRRRCARRSCSSRRGRRGEIQALVPLSRYAVGSPRRSRRRPGRHRGDVGAGQRLGEAVGAELLAGEHARQQGLLLRRGCRTSPRGSRSGVCTLDADGHAHPGRGDLLDDLEVDLVGLAAAAELLGVGQRQQAGAAQRAERLRAGSSSAAAARSASSTRGASSLSQISRVRSIRSWPSSVGISLVAGMASRVVVGRPTTSIARVSPTSSGGDRPRCSVEVVHGQQCWALGDHRVARGLPRGAVAGPRAPGAVRAHAALAAAHSRRAHDGAAGQRRGPVGAVGACARARTGRSAPPGGAPRSSCGCGPRPTSASPAGRAMPHWLMHVAAVQLGDAEDVGRVDRVPAAQVADQRGVRRVGRGRQQDVRAGVAGGAPPRPRAARRWRRGRPWAAGCRCRRPPSTPGRAAAQRRVELGPDDVGEQAAAHGEVGVGEVVRRPRGRWRQVCGEPVGPADVLPLRCPGSGSDMPSVNESPIATYRLHVLPGSGRWVASGSSWLGLVTAGSSRRVRPPAATSSSLARLNGREPKKPRGRTGGGVGALDAGDVAEVGRQAAGVTAPEDGDERAAALHQGRDGLRRHGLPALAAVAGRLRRGAP